MPSNGALVAVGALGFVLGGATVFLVRGDREPPTAVVEPTTPSRSARLPSPIARAHVEPPLPIVTSDAASAVAEPSTKLEDRVIEQAHAGLQQQAVVTACWESAVASAPEPASGTYVYDLTFDAQGNELARGITEARGESRADVGRCLMDHYDKLRVAPPGRTTQVQVTITLPF